MEENSMGFAEKFKILKEKKETLLLSVSEIDKELEFMSEEAQQVMELSGIAKKRNYRAKKDELDEVFTKEVKDSKVISLIS